MTQPARRPTVPSGAPLDWGAKDRPARPPPNRRGRSPRKPRRRRAGTGPPRPWRTWAPTVTRRMAARLGRTLPRTSRRSRRAGVGRWATSSVRAPSIALPNGTSPGQTASHARHWRQNEMTSSTSASRGKTPSRTAPMAARRPRGDADSLPVSRNVGQCGKTEPAGDARRELVAGRRVRGGEAAGRRRHSPPGSRPGLRTPAGSKAWRRRRWSSTPGGVTPHGSSPGRAPSGASRRTRERRPPPPTPAAQRGCRRRRRRWRRSPPRPGAGRRSPTRDRDAR